MRAAAPAAFDEPLHAERRLGIVDAPRSPQRQLEWRRAVVGTLAVGGMHASHEEAIFLRAAPEGIHLLSGSVGITTKAVCAPPRNASTRIHVLQLCLHFWRNVLCATCARRLRAELGASTVLLGSPRSAFAARALGVATPQATPTPATRRRPAEGRARRGGGRMRRGAPRRRSLNAAAERAT